MRAQKGKPKNGDVKGKDEGDEEEEESFFADKQ